MKMTTVMIITLALVGCGTTTPPPTAPPPRKETPNFTETKLVWDAAAQERCGHIKMDHVEYNFSTRTLTFNDERIRLEELAKRLEESHSVSVTAHALGGDEPTIAPIVDVLKTIAQSRVDKNLIVLNCNCTSRKWRPRGNEQNSISIKEDGTIELDGRVIEARDIPMQLIPDFSVSIGYASTYRHDFKQISQVLAEIDSSNVSSIFFTNRSLRVRIKAEVFQINEDGTKKVLSAPTLTVGSGAMALMRMAENRSGFQRPFFPDQDAYFQRDLANLGMRFSIGADFIADHTRVSGVIVLVKETDRTDAFTMGDVPIYGYSATKTVAPFSVVIPPGIDYVEFETAAVDSKKTMVRVKATPVDQLGEPLKK